MALAPQGYLHEGHMSLVHAARAQCDVVFASIYVNPTQFSANEDFGVYPRSTKRDLALLGAAGCVAVFMPAALYHPGTNAKGPGGAGEAGMVVGASAAAPKDAHCTWVAVEGLSAGLCGSSRPTFFRGVTTVVTKLFNIVDPDAAFFGMKDYQQWRVLQRMARDLDFAVEVVGLPIQREADGLALSSRNVLLSAEHRTAAPCLHAALAALRDAVAGGASPTAAEARARVVAAIDAAGARVDYVDVVDALTLEPLEQGAALGPQVSPALVALAAHFGKVRLIDNMEVGGPAPSAAAPPEC